MSKLGSTEKNMSKMSSSKNGIRHDIHLHINIYCLNLIFYKK
jgi:hypothetical protein